MNRALAALCRPLVLGFVLYFPQGFASARLEAASGLAARLDQVFGRAYPAGEPGAAVIVVQEGKTILRKGYGMANLELQISIAPEMAFRIGSMTKQFTAAAVLKLVEQGKLSLLDDLTKYLPDFPTHGKKITIEELLTHTSGIKSYTGMDAWPSRMREDWTPQAMIGFFKDQPLEFEPGTKWRYNNSGYVLLGAIIEKVSGKTYADFLEETIFRPLEMENTHYGSDSPIIRGRVAGYTRGPKGWQNAPYVSMTQPYAAGGLVSTVDDLARWNAALETDKLLSVESRRRMGAPFQLPDGTSTRYGYGYGIDERERLLVKRREESLLAQATGDRERRLWPASETEFFLENSAARIQFVRNAKGEVDSAVLDNFGPLQTAKKTSETLMADPPVAKVDQATYDAYVGEYELLPGFVIAVTRDGACLLAQATGQSQFEIFPKSPTDFFYKVVDAQITFVRGESGRVTGLVLHQGGRDVPAKKTK